MNFGVAGSRLYIYTIVAKTNDHTIGVHCRYPRRAVFSSPVTNEVLLFTQSYHLKWRALEWELEYTLPNYREIGL